jgi:hypothetical protein
LKHAGLKLGIMHLINYFFLDDRIFKELAGIRSNILIGNALKGGQTLLDRNFFVVTTR